MASPMPLPFRANCQPTSLGPLPHPTAQGAWDVVLNHTNSLPTLPLLARKGESVMLLGAEGLTGVEVSSREVTVDRAAVLRSLDTLYAAYLRGTSQTQRIELTALPPLLQAEPPLLRRSRAVFGLVAGPVSLALTLTDKQSEPMLNDPQLLDVLAKHLFLRRIWLQKLLERSGKPAIVWVYEPFLKIVNWPFTPLAPEDIMSAADQTLGFGAPRALWLPDAETAQALPDDLRLDLLGLPLPDPEYIPTFAPLFARLLTKKTALGWGIVPVTAEGLRTATVGRLAARFEAWLRGIEAQGIAAGDMLALSLIMPEDTLAYLEPAEADRALALTAELSSLIRQSYGVD